jgi:hypothetical protein
MGTPSALETSLQDQLAVLEVAATGYVCQTLELKLYTGPLKAL